MYLVLFCYFCFYTRVSLTFFKESLKVLPPLSLVLFYVLTLSLCSSFLLVIFSQIIVCYLNLSCCFFLRSLARLSATSLPFIPVWLGIQTIFIFLSLFLVYSKNRLLVSIVYRFLYTDNQLSIRSSTALLASE